MKKSLSALIILASFSATAGAETYIPNTRVSYSYMKDPMTDANMSIIFMDEMNDTGSYTYLSLKCAAGQGWSFGISLKTPLVPQNETDGDYLDGLLDENYLVSYRVGNKQPASVRDLSPAFLNGRLRPETVSFYDVNANNAMAQGLVDGEKIAIRIQPITDKALIKRNLDYTFLPKGFSQAFKAVNYCK